VQQACHAGPNPQVAARRVRGGDLGLNASTGVVIDAGSSGSRAYVFSWDASDPAGTIIEQASLRIKPGVSKHALAGGAAAAAASLGPLLNFALEHVSDPGSTPVYFMATAGMRLLPDALQGEVLAAVTQLLDASPFLLPPVGEAARVLKGEEEALFDWAAINAALRKLGGPPELTASVADLGGASTQLSFATLPDFVPRPDLLVPLGAARVLGVSRLGLGMNEALKNMLAGPSQADMGACLPVGAAATTASGTALQGSGNYDACRRAIRTFLDDFEKHRHGDAPAPPTLPAESQWPIYLFDNFPKGAAILLNKTDIAEEETLTLAAMEDLGRKLCAVPEAEVAFLQPQGTAQERKPCFLGAYMVELLGNTYGFPREPAPGSRMGELRFVTEVNGFSMNWPLGAMVFHTMRAIGAA